MVFLITKYGDTSIEINISETNYLMNKDNLKTLFIVLDMVKPQFLGWLQTALC